MAKFVVAVSGGVDSVVLLDMFSRRTDHRIVVAHFDHGIRQDSAEDAAFVKELAKIYGHTFESKREVLGPKTSEDRARQRRYVFLRSVARKHSAPIVTAHHADDVVETIAINLHRGTGWRGLAPLDSDIVRPLLHMTKSELIAYAQKHKLQWREDSTNASNAYLRNRLRRSMDDLSDGHKRELLALRSQQIASKKEIDVHIADLIGEGPAYSRYFFTHIPGSVAVECLRYITNAQLTRPQLERALLAIKTSQPKTSYEAGAGLTIYFSTRNFSLSLLK